MYNLTLAHGSSTMKHNLALTVQPGIQQLLVCRLLAACCWTSTLKLALILLMSKIGALHFRCHSHLPKGIRQLVSLLADNCWIYIGMFEDNKFRQLTMCCSTVCSIVLSNKLTSVICIHIKKQQSLMYIESAIMKLNRLRSCSYIIDTLYVCVFDSVVFILLQNYYMEF